MVNYREILRLSALKHVQRDVCSAMHCSDHTVRAVLKEATKHNIHCLLTRTLLTPSWSGSFSQTSTRKSALTLSRIIRTSTVSSQSPALR